MAYDIFSQLQGPQIDTNLFAQATSAGINAGNALPTPITAGIQGAIKGIGQGQAIAENFQQLAIRQHQIERQPIADAIEQTQLENAQTVADLNKLKLQAQSDLQTLELDNSKSKLEAENSDLQLQIADRNTLKRLQTQISVNPTQAAADLQNGEIAATLIRNPDAAAQIFAGLSAAKIPKDAYAALQSTVDGAAERKLAQARANAAVTARQGVASQQAKDYSMAEFRLGAINAYGDVPDNYDPRKYKPVHEKSIDPTKPDTIYLEYDGKKVKDFASTDELNGAIKDIRDVTAWKVANGLLPKAGTNAEAPTPVPNKPVVPSKLATFSEAASATPTPVPTPPANAVVAPENLQDKVPVKSQDAITQQASADLLRRAEQDASIRERLIAKGVLKEGITRPAPTPGPAIPAAITTPNAVPPVVGAPVPSSEVQNAIPTPSATPEAIDKTADQIHAQLPAPVKKIVSLDTVKSVATNPELKNLNPLQKAVVSVESGGKADAKPKNFDNSKVSAEGYFQLTSGAAKDTKVDKSIPEQNIQGGINYLNTLLNRYNNNESAALMAYNIGMGVMDSAINIAGSSTYTDLVYALDYMHSRGMYPDYLTKKNLAIVKKYPLDVLAYKQVYQNL